MALNRRQFLGTVSAGVFSFQVGDATAMMTPQAARGRGARYRVLSSAEVKAVESLGETLLPGASQAGLAHFLDSQLHVESERSLLMLRYLDVPPPYAPFYRACLAALESSSMSRYQRPFHALDAAEQQSMVEEIQRKDPAGWHGPPAPLFYFVLRSDAVDVVYGTPAGFEKLGVPYMPHIMPPSNW